MVDYTIPTYSRPDLGFKVSDYVTKYYEDKEKEEAEEEETIVAEGPQKKYKADGKEYATWGQAEHARMYPGHQALANKAGFTGLFGLNAARPGNKSYDAMIDARKTDMQDWGIDFTHTIDGKRPNGWPAGHAKSNLSGKYSSQNFKDWMDLSGGKIGMAKKTTDTIPQTAAVTVDDSPVKMKGLLTTDTTSDDTTSSDTTSPTGVVYPGNPNKIGTGGYKAQTGLTNLGSTLGVGYGTALDALNTGTMMSPMQNMSSWNELVGDVTYDPTLPSGITTFQSASKPTIDIAGLLGAFGPEGIDGQGESEIDIQADINAAGDWGVVG